jgi:hypothetical protein
MKQFFSGMLRGLANLVLSKTAMARRALLRTEAREREANEAERLDRLRNPRDYRGR